VTAERGTGRHRRTPRGLSLLIDVNTTIALVVLLLAAVASTAVGVIPHFIATSAAFASNNGTSNSCEPSGQCAPTGNVSGWHLIYETNFPGTVPLGAFSGCGNGNTTQQTHCAGLKAYGSYYTDWWAYPSGWSDTAEECRQASSRCPYASLKPPVGGRYEPQDSVSVSDHAMHIHLYRPRAGGDNVVAAVLPRQCMNHRYGMYTERFRVVQDEPGFKSAHLFYDDGHEMDYPENDYDSDISAYVHPGTVNFPTHETWTGWHTTVIRWTSTSIRFYMDGKLIGTTTKDIPHLPMSWILQNESSLLGPYAHAGASALLDEAWVACYSPS
jgi:hypothetical protein